MSNLLVQNIKHTNGTTAITVDSSAQMTVKSDGGATTTSLQQGLCKAWSNSLTASGTASNQDSFNVSSIDDDGTGDFGIHFSNSMGNATYVVTFGMDDDNTTGSIPHCDTSQGTMATGSFDFETYYLNSTTNRTNYDWENTYFAVHGDLA